jgi:hypothetical protein
MAKDYRHQPTLAALEQLIEANEVALILPKQAVDEFATPRPRITAKPTLGTRATEIYVLRAPDLDRGGKTGLTILVATATVTGGASIVRV